MASLTKPGVTLVSLAQTELLAPGVLKDGKINITDPNSWASALNGVTPEITVVDGAIKVSLPVGSVTVKLSIQGGLLVAEGKSGLPFVDDAEVTGQVQQRLDALNQQIQASGCQVTNVRVQGGQVRITTAPK